MINVFRNLQVFYRLFQWLFGREIDFLRIGCSCGIRRLRQFFVGAGFLQLRCRRFRSFYALTCHERLHHYQPDQISSIQAHF